MIDNQTSTVDDPNSSAPPADGKHIKSPEEAAAKQANKAADESEKAFKKAEKIAEKWEKQQDRLAKLHLDGDKLMLRWLRTAIVLITTGFAVERTLSYIERSQMGPRLDPWVALRAAALTLALVGFVSLWVARAQHRHRLQAIRQGDPAPIPSYSLSLWVSVIVASLALVSFLGILASYAQGNPLV